MKADNPPKVSQRAAKAFDRCLGGRALGRVIFQCRQMPVNEEQLNELDRRFEEYRQDPDKVVTWEEAKARILSGRR
jgi:hypothetical protein